MKRPSLNGVDPAKWRRKNPVSRGFIALGAILLAAVLGAGGVALVGQVGGPTNISGSVKAQQSAGPLVTELPPNASPDPILKSLNDDAQVPTPAGLAAAFAPALANPALGNLSAVVVDPESGTTLLDQAGSTQMQPGSTMKLYTAMAAAKSIKPGTRMSTQVVAGTQPGEIVLVGGGDPTLSSQPTSALYPGAASVQALADAVEATGITTVTRVAVDGGAFSGPPEASGWGIGDAPSTYAAPIYSVMVDAGRTSPQDEAQRSANPDLAAGTALAIALGNPDAEIVRGSASPNAAVLGAVQSAPIEDLIEQMIVHSDNVLSESVGRQVAIAQGMEPSFAGTVAAVTKVVQEMGIDLTGYVGYDASGISGLDRASAVSIASALAVMASGKEPLTDVVSSALAVAGYSGTLATRYQAGPAAAAAGQVRGKTGTLSLVDSLAGTVLTVDGRLLVFALIANGTPEPDAARTGLDEAAAVIAGCGCH